MNAKKITAGALVALTAVALTAVVAANPFSTQASSLQVAETTQPQAVEHLQAVEDEDADQDAQTRPYIGVVISLLPPAMAEELGVDGGALVTAMLMDGPSSGVLERGDHLAGFPRPGPVRPQCGADRIYTEQLNEHDLPVSIA